MDESLFLKLQSEYKQWVDSNASNLDEDEEEQHDDDDDDDDDDDNGSDDSDEEDFNYTDALIESIFDGNPLALIEAVNSMNNRGILLALLESSQDIEALDGTDNNGKTALHYAVLLGDIEWVSFLIQQGSSTEIADFEGFKPLHLACMKKNRISIIEKLIQARCSLDAEDSLKRTPLHMACIMENENAIHLLIRQGANILARDIHQQTPLHYACCQPNYLIIDFLLDPTMDDDEDDEDEDEEDEEEEEEEDDDEDEQSDEGSDEEREKKQQKKIVSDPNAQDIHGATPFHYAVYYCRNEYHRIVSRLISAGANVNCCDHRFRTPIFWCILGNHSVECMKVLLLNGVTPNHRDVNGCQPIHWACYLNRVEIITLLIKNSIDINSTDKLGRTPLHYAIRNTDSLDLLLTYKPLIQPDIEEQLNPLHYCLISKNFDSFFKIFDVLEDQLDPNITDAKGRSYLHYAAIRNSTTLLEYLISKNANLYAKNLIGQNIVHSAAKYGNVDFIRRIQQIERPHKFASFLSGFDMKGRRPIHLAAAQDHTAVITFLIDNRSLTRTPDKWGATPLHYAAYFGREEAIKLLLSKGNEIGTKDRRGCTPLHCAAASDSIKCYTIIHEASKDTSPKDAQGRTPLFYASSKQMFDYLSLEFPVTSIDLKGQSVIHTAAEMNFVELIGYFLQNKFYHVNITDAQLITPLHLAAFYGHHSVLTLLLEHSADPNLLDHEKKSALHYAAFSGSIECVKILKGITNTQLLDSKGRSALDAACYNAHYDCILQLLEKVPSDHNQRNPLHTFCASPHHQTLTDQQHSIILSKLVVEFGINSVDVHGRSALHYSIVKSNVSCLQKLLHFPGIDVDKADLDRGTTALMLAHYMNDEQMIQCLFDSNADPLITDCKMRSANHYRDMKIAEEKNDDDEEEEEEDSDNDDNEVVKHPSAQPQSLNLNSNLTINIPNNGGDNNNESRSIITSGGITMEEVTNNKEDNGRVKMTSEISPPIEKSDDEKKIQQLESQIRRLEDEIYNLKYEHTSQLLKQQEDMIAIKENVLNKEYQIQDLQKEIRAMKEEISTKNDKIVDLKVLQSTATHQVSLLQSEVDSLKHKAIGVDRENGEMKKVIVSLKEKHSEDLKRLEELTHEYQKQERTIHSLHQQNEEFLSRENRLLFKYFYSIIIHKKLNLPIYCQNSVRIQDLFDELSVLNLPDREWEKWVADKLDHIVAKTPWPSHMQQSTRGQGNPTPESKINQNKYNNYESYGKSNNTTTSGGPNRSSKNNKNNNNNNNINNSSKHSSSAKKESLIIEIE